ncbi:lysylphosphatidylglycerol synthase transmembrane domain-containing protein [Fibrobacterota bacterium]
MKLLKNLIKPAIAIAILFILIKKGGIDLFLIKQAIIDHPLYLLSGAGIYIFLVTIGGIRWYILVKCGGIKVKFSTVFSLHMIGLFFVTVLPGGTGGDVVKGYYIYRDTPSQKGMALSSIVIDRIVGVYALLCWGIIGILMNFRLAFTHPSLIWNSWYYLSTFLAAVLIAILFFTPFAPPLLNHPSIEKLPGNKVIKGLFDAFQVYRVYPFTLFITFLMTLVIHGCILLVFIFSALSLNVDLPLIKHGFVVPLLTMINGLPIAPGGIGVGEAAAESLYLLMGVDKGGEILLLWHVFVLGLALAGAPFYFFYKKKI